MRGTMRVTSIVLAMTFAVSAVATSMALRGALAAGLPELRPEVPQGSLSGLRRLTSYEYDNSLRDLLGDVTRPSRQILPTDRRNPFDNDYSIQEPSKALVEALDMLGREAIERLLVDAPRRDRVIGCVPKSETDADCFGQFLTRFGRLALRRTLTSMEVGRYAKLLRLSTGKGGFFLAVRAALRVFLQHPEFIYKVETGVAVGDSGTFKLTGREVATRLAYFLWASPPDGDLLDLAEQGGLDTADGVRAAARRMMLDARAREVTLRLHALWMDFEEPRLPRAIGHAMQEETAALITRVIFEEGRPWHDLLRAPTTFVTDDLARHYGLIPSPDAGASPDAPAKWVPYGNTGRKGLLSHGTFLSVGAKFAGDTSPTMRGLGIRERLLCQDIPPPPPGVSTNDPPPEVGDVVCKEDRYQFHKEGGCGKCHRLMDPIGFGLERYDQQGRFRTNERKHPQCEIAGKGELQGVGEFSGPAELADLLLKSGRLNTCLVAQLYKAALGRHELEDSDTRSIDVITKKLGGPAADFQFQDALAELVSSDAFRYRRESPSTHKQ